LVFFSRHSPESSGNQACEKRLTKFFLRIYPGDYIASYQMFIKNQIVKKMIRNLSRLTVRFLNNRTRLILDKSTLKIEGCNKSF